MHRSYGPQIVPANVVTNSHHFINAVPHGKKARCCNFPAQTAHVCFHRRKWVHTRLSETGSHTAAHTPKQGRFGRGRYHYPRSVPHVHGTSLRGQGIRTANFAAFGSWSGALPKNAESLRDSDALMRVAVPRRRGPAGLRDLFTFVEVAACTPCAQGLSACARRGVVSLPSVRFACSRNAGRPLVKAANLPFSEAG